jgi:hypothetical protein
MATITKKECKVYLNGIQIPFANPNDYKEGEITPEEMSRILFRAMKITEFKRGDMTWQS